LTKVNIGSPKNKKIECKETYLLEQEAYQEIVVYFNSITSKETKRGTIVQYRG
jgi:hypothetical protein